MSLIELYITYLEKNGPLLKIYGQSDQGSAEFLEKLLHTYNDTFERVKLGKPKSPRDVYPGLMCCARYKDNKYYRAEVKSVNQLSPGLVSVLFIDYGNTDRVELSDIRLLDDLSEPALVSVHRLASEFYLSGVKPITSEWDEHTINFIEEAIKYRSVKCAVVGKKLLKIFWGESDISSYLVGMNAAAPVSLEVQEIFIETSEGLVPKRYSVPPPAPVPSPAIPASLSTSSFSTLGGRGTSHVNMHLPFTSMVSRPTLPHTPMVTRPTLPQPVSLPIRPMRPPSVVLPPAHLTPQPFSIPVPALPNSQQFASEVLPENSEHVVFVSHVEDGPLSFAVQLKAVAEHALTKLMADLNEHDPEPFSRPLLPGSICLGRFSEDQSLCRAVVMHVMSDKCRLYYPDYGNSEVLPFSQIYEMPLQFIGVKVMALRFTLAGFQNIKVTNEMKEIFKDIVTDKELLMKVAPMEEVRTKQYCELYLHKRSVREIMKERLAKLCPPNLEYLKPHVPPRGSIETVVVTYVESPVKIVVQLQKNKETLNTLMSCVAAHCRDNTNTLGANDLKLNMPVCALYPIDSTWYRAQIKEFNDVEARVSFVDYGNDDTVPLTSLKRIIPDFVTKIRIQALECVLSGYESSKFDQELADKLFNIINEKTLKMQVLEVVQNQVMIVNLLEDSGFNIANYLKEDPVVSQVQSTKHNISSVPSTIYSNDDDGWDNTAETRHPSKVASSIQPGSGRFIIKSQKGSSNSVQNRLQKNRLLKQRSSVKKAWNDNQSGKRFSNDDSGEKSWRSNNKNDSGEKSWRSNNKDDSGEKSWRSNNKDDSGEKSWRSNNKDDSGEKSWRSNNKDDFGEKSWRSSSKDDSYSTRDRNERFSRDDRKNRKWDRDDDNSNRKSKEDFNSSNDNRGGWRNDDSKFKKKWDRVDDGEGHGHEDKFNKKLDTRDRNNEGGSGKWDRFGEGDDIKPKKWDRDNGGYNKWNKDSDKIEKSYGDGPKRFDDKRSLGKSNNNWDSKPPRSRGDGFGSRGSSKFESKKSSYGRQSSDSSTTTTPVPPKKVVVPYPDVSSGDQEIISIVYSVSPEEFFIQTDKHKKDLTQLMSTIESIYTSGGTVLTSPEKGMYCVAMYSEDEVWYRAVIESVGDSTANVLFIDYGNSEEVSLEKLKVMSPEVSTLQAQAVKCCLLCVKPKADKWSDVEQTDFAIVTEGKTLLAEFKNKIFSNDTFQIVLKDITDDDTEASIINCYFNASEDFIISSCANFTLDGPVAFKPYPITVGEVIEVQVTWFISPDSFFIQPLKLNAEFREMMEHMQEHVRGLKHLSLFDIEVGKNVIARFKEDKVLYRAEIKETGLLGPLVYFVDYGNSENVDKNQLYEVRREYSLIPSQAIACSLGGIKPSGEEWPKLGASNIEHFFEADSYTCTVLSERENGGFIVSLVNQDGNSIADQLIDNGLGVSDGTLQSVPLQEEYTTVELSLLTNQIIRAHVTCVESVTKFFVQLIPVEAAKLQQELDAFTSTPSYLKTVDPSSIAESKLYLSTMDGNVWLRAKVINKNTDKNSLVCFIDTGISSEVSNEKIFELPDEFTIVPPQVVECTPNIAIEETEIDDFKNQILNTDVLLHVDSVDSERLQVTVYSKEGIILKLFEEKSDNPKQVDVVCPMPVLKKQDKLIISHAESGAIFVQRVSNQEILKQLLGELYEFYEAVGPSELKWEVGDMCCAQSAVDSQWYRGKILTVEPEYTVKYLDYGNFEVVASDKLKKLDESFFKPESLALQVKMALTWNVSEEHLLELVPDKEFNAKIIKWQDSWYVELIDDKNDNLSDKLLELGFATEIENSPFLKKCSSISKLLTGAKVPVCRSHILSPSQFWVILNEDFEDLEHLQDRLQSSATSMKNITGSPPKSMFAAKFSDGNWYRALFLPFEKAVFSVDYGNTEFNCVELKQLTEDFLTPDGYAILCTLNVEPAGDAWKDEAVKVFDELIPDDVIVAHILKMNGVVTVDILVNDESVSDALIEKGCAVKSVLTSSVYVSHVNSPKDFYVQEENPLLDQIRENLTAADNFVVIEDIKSCKQDIFAAQFLEDGLWYRAKLLESDENGHHVLFVDYGNSDLASDFKELPSELLSIPFMAKNCSLMLPDSVESWSEEACEKFIELVADGATLFEVKFLDGSEPLSVELLLNGQSVGELISHSDIVSTIPQIDTETKDIEKIVVSHINSLSDFWIQSENAPLAELANYFVDIEDWAVVNVDDISVGQLIAALFDEDSQWYRAKVLSKIDSLSIDVLFIDYGNSSVVTEVRKLPEELSQLPAAAKRCSLKLPENVLDWPIDAVEKFKDLTGLGNVVFNMKLISSGEVSTIKLFFGEEDVSEKLLGLNQIIEENDVDSKLGGSVPAYVSHINSLEDFYVHTDRAKVDEMVICMIEGDGFEPVSEVKSLEIVAARFPDDDQWYRAKVIESNDDGSYKVFFVDYGNTSITTELKSLPENLLAIPYLAQLCSLKPVGNNEWNEDAVEKFYELSCDGNTEFGLKIITEDFPNIVELMLNGESLSVLLADNETANQESSEMANSITEENVIKEDTDFSSEGNQLDKDIILSSEIEKLSNDVNSIDNSKEFEDEDLDKDKISKTKKDTEDVIVESETGNVECNVEDKDLKRTAELDDITIHETELLDHKIDEPIENGNEIDVVVEKSDKLDEPIVKKDDKTLEDKIDAGNKNNDYNKVEKKDDCVDSKSELTINCDEENAISGSGNEQNLGNNLLACSSPASISVETDKDLEKDNLKHEEKVADTNSVFPSESDKITKVKLELENLDHTLESSTRNLDLDLKNISVEDKGDKFNQSSDDDKHLNNYVFKKEDVDIDETCDKALNNSFTKVPISEKIVPGSISHGTAANSESTSE